MGLSCINPHYGATYTVAFRSLSAFTTVVSVSVSHWEVVIILCFFSTQDDIVLATDAMHKLQGVVLPSSERGGIRIEYARTKMGDVVS